MKRCYICKQTFDHFYPFRDGWKSFPFIRELKVIGSDVDNFHCPHCGCHDRERHLFMYFDKLDIWNNFHNTRILHFAPENFLLRAIEKRIPDEYVKADLNPQSSDTQKIDVTSIPFPDEYFDFIICNHVLEHVSDDIQALRELYRVLKKGHSGILQTPYSPVLSQSFRDSKIDTDELRLKYYGQEDHVRLYGEDLFSKMKEAGFIVTRYKHKEILDHIDCDTYGINSEEDLILGTKP